MKKNRTILILGASGEIAQNFINTYIDKKNIILFDLKLNKTLQNKFKKNYFYKFTEQFMQQINKSDTIINFVGEIYSTHKMNYRNVIFLKNILNMLNKNKKKRFIHLSTAGIYNYLDLTLNKKYKKKLAYNFYEKTKIDGENVLFNFKKKNKKFDLKIIRVAGLVDLRKSNLKPNLLKLSKLKFIPLLREKKSYIFYFKKKMLIEKILFVISTKKHCQVLNLIKSETIMNFYKKFLKLNKLKVFYIPNFVESILKQILIINIKYIHSNRIFFKYLSLLFSNKKIIHK